MQREPHNFSGNGSEYTEHAIQQLATRSELAPLLHEQQRLDRLIEQGFAREEATRLVGMREHLYESTEMQQRMAEDIHIQFMRWLYKQGQLHEDIGEAKNEDR